MLAMCICGLCRVATLVDVLQLDSLFDFSVESGAWFMSGAIRSFKLTAVHVALFVLLCFWLPWRCQAFVAFSV